MKACKIGKFIWQISFEYLYIPCLQEFELIFKFFIVIECLGKFIRELEIWSKGRISGKLFSIENGYWEARVKIEIWY